MTDISALIVAAGRGTRAGGSIPKQYQLLAGKPVLYHTIERFLAHPEIKEIICVIHPNDQKLFDHMRQDITTKRLAPPIIGGATRSHSVKNGLMHIHSKYVAIHDGARPLLPFDALDRLITHMRNTSACFLALPVVDALWYYDQSTPLREQSRKNIWRAQTPQVFNHKEILSAYQKTPVNANDDAAIALAAGINVVPIIGAEENLKITRPDDFALAEKILGK